MSRKIQRVGLMLTAIFLAASTIVLSSKTLAAQDVAPVRIAILSGEGDHAPAEHIVAELEATLTEVDDVTLLERAEIRKLLEEQKISAAGLLNPATAVRLGELLSVELFLFIDKIPDSDPEACRIQSIDAKTGIVLAGQMALASDLENEPSILTLIQKILAKQRIPLDKRHYISILDMRSEEAGQLLDPLACSLWMFLTTDLQESPELILLDREHLKWLRQENELTDIQMALKTSAILLEGGIRRNADGKKISLTLFLRPLSGGEPQRIAFEFATENIADARKNMVAAISDHLKFKPVERETPDPQKEAYWYADQSGFMVKTGSTDTAPRAAEAAYALWPDRKTRLALVKAYSNNPAIYPYTRWNSNRYHPLKDLTVEEQLNFFRIRLRVYQLLAKQYKLDFAVARDEIAGISYGRFLDLDFDEYVGFGIANQEVAPEAKPLQQQVVALQRKLFDILIAASVKNPRNYEWACDRAFYAAIRKLHSGSPALDPQIAAGWGELFKMWSEGLSNPETENQFSRISLSSFYLLSTRGRPERRFYVEVIKPFLEDPHPKIRRTASLILFDIDPTPEWAETLFKAFLDDEKSQRIETENIEYKAYTLKIAYDVLQKANPDLAHKYAEDILGPFIADGGKVWRLLDYPPFALDWMKSSKGPDSLALCERMIAATYEAFRLRPDKDHKEPRLFLRSLEEYRDELGSPLSLSEPPDDPWEQYDIRRLGLGLKWVINAVAVKDNRLYCMVRRQLSRKVTDPYTTEFRVSIHKFPNGGPPLQTEVFTLTSETHISAFSPLYTAVINEQVYFNTPVGLLTLKHGEPMRLLTEADGLPGPRIEAMVVFKNELYLYALDAEKKRRTFARYDPAIGASETIYSNTSIEPERNRDINIRAIVPDEKRECFWLITYNAMVYRLNLQRNEFVEVTRELSYRLGLPASYYAHLTQQGLLYSTSFGVALLDLETYKLTYLLHYTHLPDGTPPVFGNPTTNFYPNVYDGEILITGGSQMSSAVNDSKTYSVKDNKPYLYMHRKGHEPSPCKQVYGIRTLTETSSGILATDNDGDAWLIRKK